MIWSNAEIDQFEAIADSWWDPNGSFRPLHDITPSRLDYILRHTTLADRRVLDIGCGGGLLCEEMARQGALVTGIDAGEKAIAVARKHAEVSNLNIDYAHASFEEYAAQDGSDDAGYAVVTCMEVLEHVSDPAALVSTCARMLKPGGHLFFSTINRTARAWLLAIIGAEYILRLLPRGTHRYDQLIRPSELANMALACGLKVDDISGMAYHPIARRCVIGGGIDVNYFMHCIKPTAN